MIRYADDFVVLGRTSDEVEQIKARLAEWLTPRGLAFNEAKTRVVCVDDGFDFLGFNVRRYPNGKLLIKPSPAAVMRFRKRLRTEVRALRGSNAAAVIARLNPILRGWAAYYRIGVAKDVFTKIDNHLWWLTFKWAVHGHRNKPKKWVAARYYGMFHPTRRDRWVFGDRNTGAYLIKIAWTPIVRHYMVAGTASPDDPELVDYWAARRRLRKPPLDRQGLIQLQRQRGLCSACGDLLLYADIEPQTPDEWETWIKTVRQAVRRQAITEQPATNDPPTASRLVHTHCVRGSPALLQTPRPAGLA